MGLRPHLVWITPGLVTLPFPVGVQWPRIPLATLDPAGQLWEKIQPVTGLPRGCEAARAVLKDVPTWTKRPLMQLPTHLFLPSLSWVLFTEHQAQCQVIPMYALISFPPMSGYFLISCSQMRKLRHREVMDKSMGSQPVNSGVRMQSRWPDFRLIQ